MRLRIAKSPTRLCLAPEKKLENQDKNIELVFSYLDELIEKQENPKPRNQIGFKTSTTNNESL